MFSLGGPNGYVPIGLPADDQTSNTEQQQPEKNMKRARVLCSYDASGTNELNLAANEVSGWMKDEVTFRVLTYSVHR